jgi:hypothetical protein
MLPELVDQLPDRAFGQVELFSNVLCGPPLNKHRAEGFVPAVIRIGWSSEELAANGVIHDPDSVKMSVGFRRGTGLNRSGTSAAPSMGLGVKHRENRIPLPIGPQAAAVTGPVST